MSMRSFVGATFALWSLLAPSPSVGEVDAPVRVEVSAAARAALGIAVEAAEPGNTFDGAEASATVVAPPGRLRAASSPFAGVVVQPLVMAGVEVERGTSVAIINSPDLAAAQAALESARIEVEHAEHVAERATRMHEEGLLSAHDADEAWLEVRTARVAREAAAKRLSGVRALDGRPGSFEVLAPSSGIVAHVHARSGGRVDAAGPVVSIFEGGEFWARAQAPPRVADLLEVGAPVRVDGSREPGRVVAIDPEVDERTRSLEILIQLPADGPWRLGRILELAFEADAPAGTVSLPAASIVGLHSTDVVFLEVEGGFEVRTVDVIVRSRESILARADVTAGDRVAVAGLAALKNMVENP